MAHAYTTKRGKNKKSKMGIRKDNQTRSENRQGLNSSSKDISAVLFAEAQKESIGQLMEEKKKLMIDSMRVKLLEGKGDKDKTKEMNEKELKSDVQHNGTNKEGKSEASIKINNELATNIANLLGKTAASNNSSITPSCGFSSCPNLSTNSSLSVSLSSPSTSLPSSSTSAVSLRACSACRSIYYCTPACQKSDWPRHKSTCGIIKKMRKEAEQAEKDEEKKEKAYSNFLSLSEHPLSAAASVVGETGRGAGSSAGEADEEAGKVSAMSVLSEVVNEELFLDEDNVPAEEVEDVEKVAGRQESVN